MDHVTVTQPHRFISGLVKIETAFTPSIRNADTDEITRGLSKMIKTKTEIETEKAIYISTTGELEEREFGKKYSYEFLSGAVEGLIECVYLPSLDMDMWVNEEGKINNLPINETATVIFFREFNYLDRICGNVVFTASNKNGDTVGLSKKQIEQLKELLCL